MHMFLLFQWMRPTRSLFSMAATAAAAAEVSF